ncbi:MAG: RluA family pseudouridine synthase [Clostridiales bacterium]|nr:RluA family pseudouridine synthase [Clostridiales bacterium]
MKISANDAGRVLKYVLRDRLCLSSTLLRRVKAEGDVLLNGKSVFVNVSVNEGDTVELCFPEEEADFPAEDGPLSILWEDRHFLAVDKPAGMLTHPSHSRYTGTLANYALSHSLANGGAGCHAVNRLDRDTSGIILFAKSSYAKSIAAALDYEKLYLAVVFGSPDADSGAIELPIKRAGADNMRRVTAPDGSPSITHYTVLRRSENYSLLRLRLETGRTHQIRVHMAAIGHPLLGDRLYCSAASAALSEALGVPHQLLHAESLSFTHPISGERVALHAAPKWPDNFR